MSCSVFVTGKNIVKMQFKVGESELILCTKLYSV
jgi:hypothetical protein